MLTGGRAPARPRPVLLRADDPRGRHARHGLLRRETFGPVVSLYRFHDEAEAVARANDGEYGLNASIYSQDGARGPRASPRRIKCGTVNINEAFGATFGSSTPRWAACASPGSAAARARRASSATPRRSRSRRSGWCRFAPMLGMSDETYAKVMTANLRLMKKLGRA